MNRPLFATVFLCLAACSDGPSSSDATVATVEVSGSGHAKVGTAYTYTAVVKLTNGSTVTRPITWTASSGSMVNGVFTPSVIGPQSVSATVEGVQGTRSVTGYDWEDLSTASQTAIALASDVSIPSTAGPSDYVHLLIGCVTGSSFEVSVNLPHVQSFDGNITYRIGSGTTVTATWEENDQGFHYLILPGTSATAKAFVNQLAAASTWDFNFKEYVSDAVGTPRSATFKLSGLATRLPALFTACGVPMVDGGTAVTGSETTTRRHLQARRIAQRTPGGRQR